MVVAVTVEKLTQSEKPINMIRSATRSDLNSMVELLLEFLQTSSYSDHAEAVDPEHIRRLAFAVLNQGHTWLYLVNDKPVGLLVSIKEANPWVPTRFSLRELVWYVQPEHRSNAGAGKLFVKFCQTGDHLLNTGAIQGYFTTRMGTTADYDLERRGFRLTEKLYIKD
jgi:hypothetical protein